MKGISIHRSVIIVSFLLTSLISKFVYAQTVTINGPQSVLPGTKHKYTVSFSYDLDPNTLLNFSVNNGTILSQVTNPNSLEIYCIVTWSSVSQAGYVSLHESINNITTYKGIFITSFPDIVNQIVPPLTDRVTTDCTPLPPNQCNSLQNINFNVSPPPPPYDPVDPFGRGNIAHWITTHGSPQVINPAEPGLQPPNPATGFAYMYAQAPYSPGLPHQGEGIAQKLPNIFFGQQYTFSFFMKYCVFPAGATTQLDEFYVVLANCSDITAIPPSVYQVPPIPSNSQIIYVGSNITNQSWQQVQTTFTANGNYDMFWVLPKQSVGIAGVAFAYPTLSIIGQTPNITPSGPANLCTQWEWAPTNSIQLTSSQTSNNQYQWYKDGQPIPGATSQTHIAQHEQQGIYVRTHSYTVLNPSTSCFSPIPVVVNFVPTPLLPVEAVGLLSKDVWLTIQTTENLPPATYSWNIPGALINDINVNDQFVDVFFPGTLPNSLTGYVTINGGALCANNTYTYQFLLRPNSARKRVDNLNEGDNTNNKNITVSPNPANTWTRITSNKIIKSIEVHNSTGKLITKIAGTNQQFIILNTANFQSGIYFIKIFSKEGIAINKVVIQKK